MQKRYRIIILGLIFFVVLGARLYYAFKTPYLSDDTAYFGLRQVEHIKETGLALSEDPLSYGGRSAAVLPVFYYLVAGSSLVLDPISAGKIVPNILASTLVLIVFLIVRLITKDDEAALLTAFISGFIPIYFAETVNSLSVYSLTIPLTFLLLYLLLRINERNYLHMFLAGLCVYLLTSASVILLVLSIGIYMIFLWVEGLEPTRTEIEVSIFSLFLVTWFHSYFYRDALMTHGIQIIWQNIPKEVVAQYFSQIDLASVLIQLGLIPLLCGAVMMYYHLYRKRERNMYLVMSMVILVSLLLLFRWLQLIQGLIYLSVLMTILFSTLFVLLFAYLSRTKFASSRPYVLIALFVIMLLASVIPTVSAARSKISKSITSDTVRALSMMSDLSSEPDMVIATVFEGHTVNYYTKRKSLVDSNFVLAPDVQERLRDARSIYTSAIETKPIEIMAKYDADFIIFSDAARRYYNVTRLSYTGGECFPLTYAGAGVNIYARKC
jgi:hypothetical protein